VGPLGEGCGSTVGFWAALRGARTSKNRIRGYIPWCRHGFRRQVTDAYFQGPREFAIENMGAELQMQCTRYRCISRTVHHWTNEHSFCPSYNYLPDFKQRILKFYSTP
jgi:hypothetical protein